MKVPAVDLESPAHRRCAVAMALAVPTGTATAPEHAERYLLPRYQRGPLRLNEGEDLLDLSVDQGRCHRRAGCSPTQKERQALLDTSRRSNAAHHLTELLLYREGRFILT